jgi:hypothetical protein
MGLEGRGRRRARSARESTERAAHPVQVHVAPGDEARRPQVQSQRGHAQQGATLSGPTASACPDAGRGFTTGARGRDAPGWALPTDRRGTTTAEESYLLGTGPVRGPPPSPTGWGASARLRGGVRLPRRRSGSGCSEPAQSRRAPLSTRRDTTTSVPHPRRVVHRAPGRCDAEPSPQDDGRRPADRPGEHRTRPIARRRRAGRAVREPPVPISSGRRQRSSARSRS